MIVRSSRTSVVTRPAGDLRISQDCGADPTCTVDLGTGVIDASGTFYTTAVKNLYPVTVTDTRDVDAGWTVNGDIADDLRRSLTAATRSTPGPWAGLRT